MSPGARTPFPNPDVTPDLSRGMHALLGNNIWGTNYVMWQPYGGGSATQRFRFVIQVRGEAVLDTLRLVMVLTYFDRGRL